jgi:hypothetical protein
MNEKLMDYYQVAWIDATGQKRYGVAQHYNKEAEKAFKQGFLLVSDAVLPVADRVALSVVRRLPTEFGGEYDKYIDAAHKEAVQTSEAVKQFGPGKLFSVGVADGSAWYVVTKVTKTTATVEWRGFCPDRYTDQVLGWGGSFPRRSIEPLCRSFSGLAWR